MRTSKIAEAQLKRLQGSDDRPLQVSGAKQQAPYDLERAGVHPRVALGPGSFSRSVLTEGAFYIEKVDGKPLVDWVTKLIAGEPVDDVHCAQCTAR